MYVCACAGREEGGMVICLSDVMEREADNLVLAFPPRTDETMTQHDSEAAEVCVCVCLMQAPYEGHGKCQIFYTHTHTNARALTQIKSSNHPLENITEQEGERRLLRQ